MGKLIMKKAVQYGAGNIGRGFIGQVFSQSGYEVVFIDVNNDIVKKLNHDRFYSIKIMSEQSPREILVGNVRAVNGLDMEEVADEISSADIMATAVGVNVLPIIVKPIIMGLRRRWASGNFKPLNIIICENLLDAGPFLSELMKKELSESEISLFEKTIGLVEASIGRMVPVMAPAMQEGNVLRVCVEEYNQLPVNKDAFKGEIPKIINMIPFSPFEYYMERKLYIHNMGHAITAYLGYLKGYDYVWEANKDSTIRLISSTAMEEAAKALSLKHGVSLKDINEHIDDLLYRFGNRLLGDSIKRVGKDPIRKLSYNDRFIGAANLCLKQGISPTYICLGISAGYCFDMKDDQEAVRIHTLILNEGLEAALKQISGLNEFSQLYDKIIKFYKLLKTSSDLSDIMNKIYQN